MTYILNKKFIKFSQFTEKTQIFTNNKIKHTKVYIKHVLQIDNDLSIKFSDAYNELFNMPAKKIRPFQLALDWLCEVLQLNDNFVSATGDEQHGQRWLRNGGRFSTRSVRITRRSPVAKVSTDYEVHSFAVLVDAQFHFRRGDMRPIYVLAENYSK